MKVQIFHDPVLYSLGPLPITESMLVSLGVAVLLAAVMVTLGYTVA